MLVPVVDTATGQYLILTESAPANGGAARHVRVSSADLECR